MFKTTFENGKKITDFQAVAFAEGFEEASIENQLRAWAYLIKTRLCYSLQGFFGRTANSMVQSGLISADGVINYDKLPE